MISYRLRVLKVLTFMKINVHYEVLYSSIVLFSIKYVSGLCNMRKHNFCKN